MDMIGAIPTDNKPAAPRFKLLAPLFCTGQHIAMSTERTIDLVDSASKHDDARLYKLNLLARTLKTDSTAIIVINMIAKVLSLRSSLPPEITPILNELADEYMAGLAATASEHGWFLNSITQTKIRYMVNNPEAKKMINLKADSEE